MIKIHNHIQQLRILRLRPRAIFPDPGLGCELILGKNQACPGFVVGVVLADGGGVVKPVVAGVGEEVVVFFFGFGLRLG